MEKESAASLHDSIKNSLEIKDHTKQIVDNDANKRDSSYWAKIRPIPLSDVEVRSLRINDSIKSINQVKEVKTDTISTLTTKKKSTFIKTIRNIAFGHTWSDTTRLHFRFNGLIDIKKLSFNPVDGFVYGTDFSISKSWRNGNSFNFIPDIRYAFSREKINWGINTSFSFDKLKHQQVFIRAGSTSTDINNGGGINPFINTITSLLQKRNYLRLYESEYLDLGYSTEVVNGLRLKLTARLEDRHVLNNTTNFSFLKSSKIYSDNIPENQYLLPGSNYVNVLRNQKHFDFTAVFSYTPYQKYRINKGLKTPAGSDWPTFDLTWQHGINDFSEISHGLRRSDMIRFEASRSSSIGAFGNFRWRIRAAGYIDNRSLTFYDFFHINSQPLPLLLNDYEDAFMIPSFYSLSTPEFYAEGHLKYTNPYLLLKLLPVLSNTLMRENLSLSWIDSRYQKSYTEIGYSISEIFFIGEFGVYAGFDNFKYRSVGLKATLKF